MIVEFDNVYLEYPEELEDEKDEERSEIVNTTKLSLEELQRKLEETQNLKLPIR